jgi:Na+/proline symporter
VAQGLLVAFCFTFFGGGASGAVVGGLTVPGTHRRNILLGMLLGSTIGVGMAIAVTPAGSPSATLHYLVFSSVFGWFGMVFGLYSGDNFRASG